MSARTFVFWLIALMPAVALCDDPPPPQGVWTGKGQAGFVASQGNTEARTANAALDLGLLEGPWQHALHLDGLYAQSTGVTSADRWDAGWQSNYTFSSDFYTFGSLRYEHDLFSGFDFQTSAAAGIGYKIIDLSSTKLSVQVGPGYREEEPELIYKNAAGVVIGRTLEGSTGSGIVSAGLDYSQALTGTTALTDKLLVESGGGNTLYTDALALTIKMSTRLALSLGYNLQDNTAPPPGLKKLDTIETVNLVYAF